MALHVRRLAATAIVASLCLATVDAQRGRLGQRRPERAAGPGGTRSVAIAFGGHMRRYLLHVPVESTGARALPLVVAFHGGSQSPEDMERMTGFSAAADRDAFVAAYPEGIDKSWADGRGTTAADTQHVDDVGFTRAVVADVGRAHAIDGARVFATGASNGGTMSYRLGCDAADVFAAIAPVIAAMPSALAPTCRPSVPVAVVSIQGTADPLMPFGGGEEGEGSRRHVGAGGRIESARATSELWRSIDGCRASPMVTLLPARVSDGTTVTRRTYGGCHAAAEVTSYEIQGGGHRWPPQQARTAMEAVAGRAFGVSSQNIDATAVIWDFFNTHARR